MKEKEINNIKILYKESSLDDSGLKKINKYCNIVGAGGTVILLIAAMLVLFLSSFMGPVGQAIWACICGIGFVAGVFVLISKLMEYQTKNTPVNYHILSFLLNSDIKLFQTDEFIIKLNGTYISINEFKEDHDFILEEVNGLEMSLVIDLTTTERKMILNKKSN